jgi:RHS repeat-associated protein
LLLWFSGSRAEANLGRGWLYQGQLNPVAELDGAGQVVARFIYGSRPNVPDYMVKNGTTYRLISDHVGSVRLVVDATTGVVAQRLDYDEWGRVTLDTTPGFQPFGFAGGLYDPDTKLVRFGARDYDAEVGRWTTRDPIRFDSSGTNLYSYALTDPVNLLDLNGLDVVNHSAGPIFVLPEKDKTGEAIECVPPGGRFTGRQDALAVPGSGSVFKTTDFVNAEVGASGSVRTAPSLGAVGPALGAIQFFRGGTLSGPALDAAGTAFEALLARANAAAGECGCHD